MNAVANTPELCARAIRILVLEDHIADAELCLAELFRAGLECDAQCVQTRREFLHALDACRDYDLVLADYSLPDWTGTDALAEMRRRGLDIPLIIVTGTLGDEEAVELVKKGASDYVLKDRLQRLPIATTRALAEERERREKIAAWKAVERSAREYRTLFEAANVGILVFDPASEVILEANPEACRMYHVGHDHLVGRSLKEFTKNVARGEQQLVELLREGECDNFESIHVAADGTEINVLISSRVIEYRGARAILSINRDITQRIAAEERYRKLFQDASDVIFRDDLAGNIELLNPAAERVTGYTSREMAGRNILDFVAPEYVPILAGFMQRPSSSSRLDEEIDFIFRDGRRVRLEVSAHYVMDKGHPVGIEGIARDVTERRRLQDELKQAQKMEAIGQLAGGIAHDFNNLLTVIGGYAELALSNVDESHPAHRALMKIQEAERRAADVTARLLAFSRRQMTRPEPLNLNDVVSGMQQMLRPIIPEDINVSLRLASSSGLVFADRGQVEQILMNLVVNARDAMPRGGQLEIATEALDVTLPDAVNHAGVPAGAYVMLSVADTGTGMDEKTLGHIFEPFFTTKEKGKGTGLGLPMVYGVVHQHKAHIRVTSEPGKGTQFRIYFPQHHVQSPQKVEVAAVPARAPASVRSATILLAEDEPMLRPLFASALRNAGYLVLEAENGEDAARISREYASEIDMLVTDVVMPRMDGRELADKLLASRPRIRVVFLSGYTDDDVIRHGVDNSEITFLKKPFATADLLRTVGGLLATSGIQ